MRLRLGPRRAVPARHPAGPHSPLQRRTEPADRRSADRREWVTLRWGLVPAWASELQAAYSTINACAETVAEKPAFRRRRCLIPADRFYEWRKVDARKQPYCIAPADGQPFAFAGLWERWERDGRVLESGTILVTSGGPGLLDKILPGLSGFLRFRLLVG